MRKESKRALVVVTDGDPAHSSIYATLWERLYITATLLIPIWATHRNVAHISLTQWGCLGNKLCVMLVILHCGIGCRV